MDQQIKALVIETDRSSVIEVTGCCEPLRACGELSSDSLAREASALNP